MPKVAPNWNWDGLHNGWQGDVLKWNLRGEEISSDLIKKTFTELDNVFKYTRLNTKSREAINQNYEFFLNKLIHQAFTFIDLRKNASIEPSNGSILLVLTGWNDELETRKRPSRFINIKAKDFIVECLQSVENYSYERCLEMFLSDKYSRSIVLKKAVAEAELREKDTMRIKRVKQQFCICIGEQFLFYHITPTKFYKDKWEKTRNIRTAKYGGLFYQVLKILFDFAGEDSAQDLTKLIRYSCDKLRKK